LAIHTFRARSNVSLSLLPSLSSFLSPIWACGDGNMGCWDLLLQDEWLGGRSNNKNIKEEIEPSFLLHHSHQIPLACLLLLKCSQIFYSLDFSILNFPQFC
jgi:hypothetical protein